MALRILAFLAVLTAAVTARAQNSVPTVIQPFPAQSLPLGGPAVTVDVRNYISIPGLSAGAQFAQFETTFGRFNVELRADAAPRHVTNFLNYVQRATYNSTFIHRAVSLETGGISIVQGGGYSFRPPAEVNTVPRAPGIALEYNLANARGTIAAARTTDINSASSEWYFNVRDNSTILGPANGGGYSVFGRVLGTGMTVVDQMAAVQVYNAGTTFTNIPLRNYTTGTPNENNLVMITSVEQVSLFPTGGGRSVIDLTADNSAPNVVSHVLSGSTITLEPIAAGTATITIRATDTNGNTTSSTFNVTVPAIKPVFASQPISHHVGTGSTVVFHAPAYGAASYVWRRNNEVIPGATTGTLVITNASAAHEGTYIVTASSSLGTTESDAATLTVANVAPTDVARLINLSLLTTAGSGSRILTMGAVIGPINSPNTLPLVIRAVGPTIGLPPYNVAGVLPDPVMSFYSQANTSTPISTNDNWGGGAELSNAFTSVGAFSLPQTSLDSAIYARDVRAGGYSVQVTGKNNASGSVIAEMYDASGTTRTASSPRLINLSTVSQIDAGSSLAVGFVLRGETSRTVLIRGVGPSLSQFNIEGRMVDPQLELFDNNSRRRLGGNDDWAGELGIANATTAVGAFPLTGGSSRDAAILITLPPGLYSANISGGGNTGGTAIVEVYEVP